MLSYEVFKRRFLGVLCPHHRTDISNPDVIESWYESFCDSFSDESFVEVCKMAFDEAFMPKPKWFKEQREYLAERARLEAPPMLALPEDESIYVVDEATRAKIKALLSDLAKVADMRNASRKRTQVRAPSQIRIPTNLDPRLFTTDGQPIEAYALWLKAQPSIKGTTEEDRASMMRIMTKNDRIQSQFLSLSEGDDF